jgi:hypothetical protein
VALDDFEKASKVREGLKNWALEHKRLDQAEPRRCLRPKQGAIVQSR